MEIKLDSGTGYQYFIDYGCPLATGNSGRVYYHRYVVSLFIDEWLTEEDIVHHIDGNKLNNDIDNLEVLTNSEHARLHMLKLEPKMCITCKSAFKPKKATQKFCSTKCITKSSVSATISIEDIKNWVIPFGWRRASRELGMSDNGLRKLYKKLTGLDPKFIKDN